MRVSKTEHTNHDRQKSTGGNTDLAKVAVQCSADTIVVNQSLVLRINICGENRHLRQARNLFARVQVESLIILCRFPSSLHFLCIFNAAKVVFFLLLILVFQDRFIS